MYKNNKFIKFHYNNLIMKKELKIYLEKLKEEMNLMFYEANMIDLMQAYNQAYEEILKNLENEA